MLNVSEGGRTFRVLVDRSYDWYQPVPLTAQFMDRVGDLLAIEGVDRLLFFSGVNGQAFSDIYDDPAWDEVRQLARRHFRIGERKRLNGGYIWFAEEVMPE